jgi:hypothetical protein
MSDKIEYSRLLLKRTTLTGEVPTVPPLSAVTLNQFTPTDLFVGELFLNAVDDLMWVRTETGILPISLSGSTGSTSTSTLTQVLNEGNTTGGFDIIVSSGNTVVFNGLETGESGRFLALNADGGTIIATGSGGSGTSGTSGSSGSSGSNGSSGAPGTSGTSGSSGVSGTSGSSGVSGSSGLPGTAGTSGLSGVNGTAGTSGISGIGAFLPLSGGTVTGDTTFTQDLFLTNLTSGGSQTLLTIDSDTKQVYTATDFLNPFTGNVQIIGQSYVKLPTTGTTTSATTINWNDGNVQEKVLGASTTFTFSNPNAGGTYILIIKQSSGGSNTITWPGTVTWAGGTPPTMTATANKFDVFTFVYDGSKYFGSYVQNFT